MDACAFAPVCRGEVRGSGRSASAAHTHAHDGGQGTRRGGERGKELKWMVVLLGALRPTKGHRELVPAPARGASTSA